MLQRRQIPMLIYPPERPIHLKSDNQTFKTLQREWPANKKHTYLFSGGLFLLPIAHNNIRTLPAKAGRDPLEAALLADLGRTVDILDVEHIAQPVQQQLGKRRHQLRRRHEHIHIVRPRLDNWQRLQRQAQPVVGQLLDVIADLGPLLALGQRWVIAIFKKIQLPNTLKILGWVRFGPSGSLPMMDRTAYLAIFIISPKKRVGSFPSGVNRSNWNKVLDLNFMGPNRSSDLLKI